MFQPSTMILGGWNHPTTSETIGYWCGSQNSCSMERRFSTTMRITFRSAMHHGWLETVQKGFGSFHFICFWLAVGCRAYDLPHSVGDIFCRL